MISEEILRKEIVEALYDLQRNCPLRFWLAVAAIEATVGVPLKGSPLKGKSKGSYKRIIREGRMLASDTSDPGILATADRTIAYIRANMEIWRR